MHSTNDITLILGGTGKTGRRVAERLRAQGQTVRTGSRSGEPPFDWEDRSTWPAAVAGASALYISFFPDIALPGAVDAVAEVARLARDGGARRLVLLSGRGEPEAQAAEAAVQAIAPQATIVRCSWFMQNFSEGYLRDAVLAGEVILPVDGVPEPFVDCDDIADVAAAALSDDGHAGEVYELTGPQLMTFAEAAAQIAHAAHRPVAYQAVSQSDFTAAMRADGVPDDVVGLLAYLFSEVLDGRNAHLADGVQRALGRPPRDFADFAAAAATAGAWDAP